MKRVIALAALAAIGFAGAAYAGDAAAPKAMSDSEMDKVTAAGQPSLLGRGLDTASRTPAADTNWANRPNNPPDQRGIGRCTAIFAQGGICGP
jgi:hypothetical protein